ISGITGTGTLGISILAGTARDLAGNLAGSSTPSTTFNVDNTAPVTPTLVLAAASDSGPFNNDQITSNSLPTFTGTAEANSLVTILRGSTVIAQGTASGGGTFSLTATNALVNGANSITATSTDAVGNVSAASTPLVVILDRTVPTLAISAPVISPSATIARTGSTVSYTVTYTDVNFYSNFVSAAIVTTNKSGTANGAFLFVTTSATSVTIIVTNLVRFGS